jgi:hypothetical protein
MEPENHQFHPATPTSFRMTEGTFLVPCSMDLATGFFQPLFTVKDLFPHLEAVYPAHRKGPWTDEEDQLLLAHVETRGPTGWSLCAQKINESCFKGRPIRQGKQCRERWNNHLNPNLCSKFQSETSWTVNEDLNLLRLQQNLGKSWSHIAQKLPGRTENSVKNRWNSLVKRGRKDLRLENAPVDEVARQVTALLEGLKECNSET